MIPKYCAGNLISLNILLLNDTSAPNIPEKMAPNSIKFFILLDLKILLIDFFNSFNSVPILTFFFSFNVSTSSNFTDITIETIFIINKILSFCEHQNDSGDIICSYSELPIYLNINAEKANEVLNTFLRKKYLFKQINHYYLFLVNHIIN